MVYTITLSSEAQDNLKKLDNSVRERIIKKMEQLENDPMLGKPLSYELKGLRSLRVGDYRVLYQIQNNELVVLVIKISHRREVYEQIKDY